MLGRGAVKGADFCGFHFLITMLANGLAAAQFCDPHQRLNFAPLRDPYHKAQSGGGELVQAKVPQSPCTELARAIYLIY